MNILILGTEVSSRNDIRSYTEQWMFHLPKELKKWHSISWLARPKPEQADRRFVDKLVKVCYDKSIDVILAPGVNYLGNISIPVLKYLSKSLSEDIRLAQVSDGPLHNYLTDHIDYNFTVKDHGYLPPKNYHVSWASDSKLFYPEDNDQFTIFLDHSNFGTGGWDYSLTIKMGLAKLSKKHDFIVKTLTNRGIEIIDFTKPISVEPFTRYSIPVTDFAAELRTSNAFFVTHQESIGLTALEASLCGAVVYCPEGCISNDRLSTIDHVSIRNGNFNIDTSIRLSFEDRLDINKRARANSWHNVAKQIHRVLMT